VQVAGSGPSKAPRNTRVTWGEKNDPVVSELKELRDKKSAKHEDWGTGKETGRRRDGKGEKMPGGWIKKRSGKKSTDKRLTGKGGDGDNAKKLVGKGRGRLLP